MTDTSWWVLVNFEQQGPWPEHHVQRAAAAGHVGPESLVWCAGMPEWAPLRTTWLGHRLLPPSTPTPPPPPVSAMPPSSVASGPRAPLDAQTVSELLDVLDDEVGVGPPGAPGPAAAAPPTVAAPPTAAPAPTAPAAAQHLVDPASTCPYCHTTIGSAGPQLCPSCAAPHHTDCWQELTGCAVVGCEAAPPDASSAVTATHPAPTAAVPQHIPTSGTAAVHRATPPVNGAVAIPHSPKVNW